MKARWIRLCMLVTMALVSTATMAISAPPASALPPIGHIDEFNLGRPDGLNRITMGPDGDLWFTEGNTDSIGRMKPNGVLVHEYTTPRTGTNPIDIVTGPDGNIYFTEFGQVPGSGDQGAGGIGRVNPATGAVDEFLVHNPGDQHVFGLTFGPDGNIWFIVGCCGHPPAKIGRMNINNPSDVALFSVAPGTSPVVGITSFRGAIWYTAANLPCADPTLPCSQRIHGYIQRMTTSGNVNGNFLIPEKYADPSRLVPGPDGNLYFTDQGAIGANGCCASTFPAQGTIGRITPKGAITLYPTPTQFSNPAGITVGPDNNIWFTEYAFLARDTQNQHGGNYIGRLSLGTKKITEFPIPIPFARADGITIGPNGYVYFVEDPNNYRGNSRIGRIRTVP